MKNLSYENELDLHENEHVEEANIHIYGFVRRLVLKERQKASLILLILNRYGNVA